ncbi:MAG: glycosyltransferase family 2 protein [bacterium]|nr:glycosyltransferase family 2 protein [bacterium]
MRHPRITVGLPVFNGAPYVARTIESVLAQTFEDFELIVSDNASTDDTESIVRTFEARDERVRYVRREENVGAAENFNGLVHEARGELFKWAAADDESAPDFLHDCVAALDAAGSACVLAFPRTRWIDAESQPIGDLAPPRWNGTRPSTRLASLWRDPRDTHLNKCSPVCGLIRKDILVDTGLIGSFGSSDKVTLVELALRGDWAEVPAPHFLRRVHAGSSLEANTNAAAVAAWFDPAAGERIPMPRVRLFRAYRAAIARAPLAASERVRCRAKLLRLLRREWRVLGGEYKRALKARLAG